MTDDTSTLSWNSVADDWVKHADENDYRNLYLMPRMLAMLGDVDGKRILDVWLRRGWICPRARATGADVRGVDGSRRVIEVARERTRVANVNARFLEANANALEALESGRFDVAIAAMSLMDVEDYSGAISEIYRVLHHRGEMIMSTTYPCFNAPVSGWIAGESPSSHQVFVVDRYFDRIAWPDRITTEFSEPIIQRHRPLEDFMAAPLKCGFRLRAFCEPSATAEEVARSRRFKKLERIPYFLFMRWLKE